MTFVYTQTSIIWEVWENLLNWRSAKYSSEHNIYFMAAWTHWLVQQHMIFVSDLEDQETNLSKCKQTITSGWEEARRYNRSVPLKYRTRTNFETLSSNASFAAWTARWQTHSDWWDHRFPSHCTDTSGITTMRLPRIKIVISWRTLKLSYMYIIWERLPCNYSRILHRPLTFPLAALVRLCALAS